MSELSTTGRWVGAGVLFGYAADISVNFLLFPGIRVADGPAGLFAGGVQHASLLANTVLLSLLSELVSLLIAGLVFGAVRNTQAAWLGASLLAVKAAAVGMSGLELAGLQMIRSFGEALSAAGAAEAQHLLQPLHLVLVGLRDGAHFPHMMTGGFGALLLYLILYATRYVPRALSIAGVFASLCQIAGVSAGVITGEANFTLLIPLLFVQLTLAVWLLVRDFRQPEMN